MYAEVNLTLARRDHVLVVPVTAVDAGGQVMVVTTDNRLEVRKIALGMETADRVEVKLRTEGRRSGGGCRTRRVCRRAKQVQPKMTAMNAVKDVGHVRLRDTESLFHRRGLPDHRRGGREQFGAHAGGHVPGDEYSRWWWWRRSIPACRRSRSRPISRSRFERFFTLGSGIEHIESRSLPGVSVIKVYFQPGTNPDSAVTTISNLAMAQLRRLPPGTLPPVVLKFDASSLPVCLVTFKGEGLNETQLRDLAQFQVRNQIASVPGASVPQPFGGRYRQIMVYADPYKLEAHQLSLMDVVRSVNDANLILPAGDVQIGPLDYNIYTNSQLSTVKEINNLPVKMVGQAPVRVSDIG